ncbi:hypothetical protein H4R33_004360 [Dimargaris cristalligena]|uniref:Armadillo-type protein n=1 Tax=Dimargaris cristalligena TaxID=215637 RepID=A0A4Q0A218_9FUNG|nr:hypothetical protein H4R33_004360 [Dimargaris cristalligena]RKP40176.1 armadillo-type protein [Dimargaris cristalligena]|eukprot:RKP40176.1 armadillo-type protein [Dimargaris cristalligena]
MDPQFTASLNEALQRFIKATDTQEILSLTATLNKDFYSQPASVPALTEIASQGAAPELRQLAAVELRKRVIKQWVQVPTELQVSIQKHLLERVVQDPEAAVRHALSRVISAIAEVIQDLGKWSELLPFLFQLSRSAQTSERETGIYVLYTLFEVIADGELQNTSQALAELFGLFAQSIRDPESRTVRVTTLQALGKVAEFLEPENTEDVKTFRDLVPAMVNVIEDCLSNGDEEGVSHGFDVFDSLLVLETPLLTKHFADLVQFFMTVAGNRQYPDSIRSMALSFISMATMFKRSKLQKLKLVTPLIQALMPIIAEPSEDGDAQDQSADDSDDEDDDDDSASKVALTTLSSLGTYLPASAVFPVTMQLVLQYMQNPTPSFRKAAMLSFAVLIEPSVDLITDKINDLIRLVVAGLQDPAISVRRAACMALGSFAENFEEEIAEHHATLLPLIFNLMGDAHTDVIKYSCNALDAILEGMDSTVVVEYLPTLINGLTHLLETAPVKIQITVTGALGSAANAAGSAFLPYFDNIIQRMRHQFTVSTVEDDFALRGIAVDTVGVIASAVGKEVFAPHLEGFMKLALEGLELSSGRLRDCTFLFFGTISEVFGDDFAPYLQFVVPPLLQSCRVDESIQVGDGTTDIEGTAAVTAALEDDEEELLSDQEDDFYVNTAVADEKEVAADVLGEIFSNTGTHFLPYAEATIQELVKLADHDADHVRTAVVGALFKCLLTFHRISGNAPWVAGWPVQVPVNQTLAQLIQIVMPAVMAVWAEEEVVGVVIQICVELTQALKTMGPALLVYKSLGAGSADSAADLSASSQSPDANLTALCNELGNILQKKALCQEDDADEDNQLDDEDKQKRDAVLTGGAADVVAALCLVLGPHFTPYFQVFLPFIAGYYTANEDVPERSMAIGCLGESVSGLKEGCAPFVGDLLPLFLQALADPDPEVKSNAAFAVGALVFYAPAGSAPIDVNAVLGALHTIFAQADRHRNAKNLLDNACGALARISMKDLAAVPLPDILSTLVRHLPLQADFAENEPVYDFVCGLIAEGHPAVQPHLPQLKGILQSVQANADEQLKPAQLAKVNSVLQNLA